MKFWDTSAIVPLCVEESQSEAVKSILAKDTALVVWWATRVECISALMRQAREGGLSVAGEKQAREVLETLAETRIEIEKASKLGFPAVFKQPQLIPGSRQERYVLMRACIALSQWARRSA